jgi:integrase/recombinase XerD
MRSAETLCLLAGFLACSPMIVNAQEEPSLSSRIIETLKAKNRAGKRLPVSRIARTFLRFCHERNWIDSNPAVKLKMGKSEEAPVEPFTREEVAAIIAAVPRYQDRNDNVIRLRALVLLLRYSGLRLGDAVTLERNRIESGRLFLRTAKTDTRVFVPLPKIVLDALELCPGRYFFWTGESKRKSVKGNWQRAMKKLFKLANVSNGHAHRFRHTFAAELLMSGASLTNVAQLLGHSSEKITERHYSAWVKGRQEKLEADVRRAWEFEK